MVAASEKSEPRKEGENSHVAPICGIRGTVKSKASKQVLHTIGKAKARKGKRERETQRTSSSLAVEEKDRIECMN